MLEPVIAIWHEFIRGRRPDALDQLLYDDVVFYSPVVLTPQVGKALTTMYLRTASRALMGDAPPDADSAERADDPGYVGGSFRYTKQVLAGDTAVLEFETMIAGMYVNGVDIIRCNEAGRIVEFRVMIRPLKALSVVHQQMGEALAASGLGRPRPRRSVVGVTSENRAQPTDRLQSAGFTALIGAVGLRR